jgi:hypothetical protein
MTDFAFDLYYLLDVEDCIVEWDGPQWTPFAEGNEAGAAGIANFRGVRIYDQVAGHFTRRFLRAFFTMTRASDAPQIRCYRCDSPATKRLMEMRALAAGDGGLRVEHRLVAEMPALVEVACREAAGARRGGHLRCSICNRLRRRGAQEWRESDDGAVKAGPLRVVHTVCPDCRLGVAARLPLRPASGVPAE